MQATLSLSDRFRHWYAYERHCNAKVLAMLESVPQANRSSPQFTKAVGKFAHLIAARHFWFFRLGKRPDRPDTWFPPSPLEELPARLADIEQRWTNYLGTLTDADLGDCILTRENGERWQWNLADLLTQLFGHAWYHRGQIAMLVADLGGKHVDTDYIFWCGNIHKVS